MIIDTRNYQHKGYVNVRIPDLADNSEWICTCNGKDIAFEMCDTAFLERVHHNEFAFTCSTQLYVKMLIRYKETGISSYKIVEVLAIKLHLILVL